MPATVAIQKCEDYDLQKVETAINNLIDSLGGMEKFIGPGQRVLLKPNLQVGKAASKAVCTQPEVLRVVASLVKQAGAEPFIGDSPAFGSARSVSRKCGIMQVAEELGIEVVNFAEAVEVPNPHSEHYRTLKLAREVIEADAVISLSRVKTHALLLMTMAVKNLFGCVVGRGKTQWHLRSSHNLDAFAEMLLSVYKLANPVLNIADGIVAMQGNGPNSGDPRPLGLIMAGTDAVAMDRVIGEIVGLKPNYNLTATLGTKLGLGEGSLENIQILGPALSEIKVSDFKLPHGGPPKDQRLPWPINRILGDSTVTIPEIDEKLCTACGTCVTTCPAEAMQIVERGDNKYVEIDRRACIRCFCCQEVCPEHAITPHTGWLARKFFK